MHRSWQNYFLWLFTPNIFFSLTYNYCLWLLKKHLWDIDTPLIKFSNRDANIVPGGLFFISTVSDIIVEASNLWKTDCNSVSLPLYYKLVTKISKNIKIAFDTFSNRLLQFNCVSLVLFSKVWYYLQLCSLHVYSFITTRLLYSKKALKTVFSLLFWKKGVQVFSCLDMYFLTWVELIVCTKANRQINRVNREQNNWHCTLDVFIQGCLCVFCVCAGALVCWYFSLQ